MVGEESTSRLNSLIEAFFANLRRRNRAPHTLTRWRPELRRFAEWVGERELHEITAADLDAEFLPWWEADFRARNGRDPAPNSLRAAIQALRSFYAWLEKFDRLRDPDGVPFRNPAAALEAPVIRRSGELDWLRSEEDDRLLAHAMKNEREAILDATASQRDSIPSACSASRGISGLCECDSDVPSGWPRTSRAA